MDHAGHGAVANSNQKGLAGDCRQAQHPTQRVGKLDARGIEPALGRWNPRDLPMHMGRLAEQHRHGYIDRPIADMCVL